MHGDAVDTMGIDGVWFDPLWRVEVQLTPLERRLLETWPVRRLAFIAHAGAASITTTQSYSRLEHSLGVLALVAHFAPDDHLARATALLHDVGHLPFSHSLEGLGGLEHHGLGRRAIRSLAAEVDGDDGVDPLDALDAFDGEAVIALDEGAEPSVLTPRAGGLKLDHLDSFLRSGQAHGRTTTPPHELLRRLRLVDGTVDADADDALELADLAVREALAQRSAANLVPVTVLRDLVARLLGDGALSSGELTGMTDDTLWGRLLTEPATAADAELLRRRPQAWRMVPSAGAPGRAAAGGAAAGGAAAGGAVAGAAALRHVVRRSYLDLPTIDGRPMRDERVADLGRALPIDVVVERAG
ncbi:hypothetical protein SAMN02800687_3366 [Curtobacterium sp. UNCCL20]|uniref:HD domain-containing protein n=1 Tax=Curtobacterium sp. UNCCL20 TaxID=1502773 RepID=UPI000889EF01|nr:HD domain-containing protein [Curtobacterium sp. UNCCL20]SDR02800.1 hypothetical protein SAMN02800687_3366 [Curtobacterium sp. UNCCL20]